MSDETAAVLRERLELREKIERSETLIKEHERGLTKWRALLSALEDPPAPKRVDPLDMLHGRTFDVVIEWCTGGDLPCFGFPAPVLRNHLSSDPLHAFARANTPLSSEIRLFATGDDVLLVAAWDVVRFMFSDRGVAEAAAILTRYRRELPHVLFEVQSAEARRRYEAHYATPAAIASAHDALEDLR